MTTIVMLPTEDWRIIKTIWISKLVNNVSINGQIIYSRPFSEEYKMMEKQAEITDKDRFNRCLFGIPENEYPNDEIDEFVFEAIQRVYPEAKRTSKLKLFNVDERDNSLIKQRPNETCEINILPRIPSEGSCTSQLKIFQKKLSIYVDWLNSDNFRNEGYTLYYNIDQLDYVEQIMTKFDNSVFGI